MDAIVVVVVVLLSLEVLFSWKIAGNITGRLDDVVVWIVVDGSVEVVVSGVLLVVGSSEVVGGGGGGVVGSLLVLGSGVGDGFGVSAGESSEGPPEPSKATMLAWLPFFTVTTQKLAPPAPDAASLLTTLPPPDGLIWQGRPSHPPLGHSILTPKSGLVELSPELSQTGL